jgi:hypothetical protein
MLPELLAFIAAKNSLLALPKSSAHYLFVYTVFSERTIRGRIRLWNATSYLLHMMAYADIHLPAVTLGPLRCSGRRYFPLPCRSGKRLVIAPAGLLLAGLKPGYC